MALRYFLKLSQCFSVVLFFLLDLKKKFLFKNNQLVTILKFSFKKQKVENKWITKEVLILFVFEFMFLFYYYYDKYQFTF